MFFLEVSALENKNIELVKKVLRIRSSHSLRKMSPQEYPNYSVDINYKEELNPDTKG